MTLPDFTDVILSYFCSPQQQWLFFSLGYETQWKTHYHPSCLLLVALTEIIYTPAYWNYGERERGGGGSVYSCGFVQALLLTGG